MTKHGFNSRMVRLELGFKKNNTTLPISFQFQDGTIRTTGAPKREVLDFLFQFQDGTIRTGRTGYMDYANAVVSIPGWYD